MNNKKRMIFTGMIVGILSVLLVIMGNPANMGICVACFIRDIAGSLGFHRASIVQYIRPEIIGFVLGSFIISKISGEFKTVSGSSPLLRFVISCFVMIGALVFLGCPLRMVLRIAGGDLNAIVGLFGFAAGIFYGTKFLRKGFTLGRSYKQKNIGGYILPLISVGLLALIIIKPSFIFISEKGPGSMFAPIMISLGAGLIVGVLSQKSRLCMVGGFRDLYLMRDFQLIIGFISILVTVLILNLILGNFNLSFVNQPAAHADGLWNFLGMFLTGFGSLLLGGCPLRQTILAGQGNLDSVITFLGLIMGSAIAHNFLMVGSTANGHIAVVIGIISLSLIACFNIEK